MLFRVLMITVLLGTTLVVNARTEGLGNDTTQALLAIIILATHFLYLGYIHPEADAVLSAAAAAGQSAPRDLVVILKDLEQEICIILGLWST